MPDNINISTPISGNTNINRPGQTSAQKEPMQINVVDPTRVNQPNTDKQAEQNMNMDMMLSRNSVFSTYFNQIRQVPVLSQTLGKMVFELFARKDSLTKAESLPAILKKLTAATEMEKADILKNLQFQGENQTKFSDPIFELLRGIESKNPGKEFDVLLAKFLKSYDTVFSAPQTMKSIKEQLNLLTVQLPKYYSKKLQPLMAEFLQDNSADSIQQNLLVLKEKILPLLSEYSSRTKDIGMARDTITLLVHTLARLNIGSREDLVNKFTELLDYCRFSLNMSAGECSRIQELFAGKLTGTGEMPQNVFYESLLKTLSEGSKQGASGLNQTLCKAACSSLLLDNSVYMPFTHLFLPVSYHGQAMFTEIWIEKDSGKEHSYYTDDQNPPSHMYITFDIQNLGYFEMLFEVNKTRISVQLNCPSALVKQCDAIHDSLMRILAQNGFLADGITVSADNTPRVQESIRKRIYDWRDAINVTI